MSETTNPLMEYEQAAAGLKAQSGPDLPPALGGALGRYLDALTNLLHDLVDALDESDQDDTEVADGREKNRTPSMVVLATMLDASRDVAWGPFQGPQEAERCAANLAANPRVVQARLLTEKQLLQAKKSRRPSAEDFRQWVGGPGRKQEQGSEGAARPLGDISKEELRETLSSVGALEATSQWAIEVLRKENSRLESENARLRANSRWMNVDENPGLSDPQPEAMAAGLETPEGQS